MYRQPLKPIAILGAGSWGTALALYLARCGQEVRIWSIESAEITAMLTEKANNRYLPGYSLPISKQIHPTVDLAEALDNVDDIMMVVPSVGFRQTLLFIKPLIRPSVRIICATKGLDLETGQLLNQVTEDILGTEHPFAVFSGPSFAREVASGLPTTVVIASHHQDYILEVMERFNSTLFRLYPSDDVIGVEVGGVVKNVIAIATGISDGMGFGANARSALITHGLAEMIRLGVALGGKEKTFLGLAGLGDLVLTCTDHQSRNLRLGIKLGEGCDLKDAMHAIGQVVEGKRNAELLANLAQRLGVHMPICKTVWRILHGQCRATDVVEQLLF